MMRFSLLALAAALIFAPVATAQDLPDGVPAIAFGAPEPLSIRSDDETHEFTVEIAETDAQKARGMMFRTEMSDETGMLFKYPENRIASIWMDNTPLSLDILFVRQDGSIAKIEYNAVPYSRRSMFSDVPVTAVVELRGGLSQELGIEPGDVVIHPWFENSESE